MQDGSYTFVIVFQGSAQNKGKRGKRYAKNIRVVQEYWETGILILFVARFRFCEKSVWKCKKWELKV